MAAIVAKNDRFIVICSYYDAHGVRKQKWETFKTLAEAKARKIEIEYNEQQGTFTVPCCTTLRELLAEYVDLYGKTKWSMSAYACNTGLIKHYIDPIIGHLKVKEITSRTLEKYYKQLLKTPAVPKMTDKKRKKEKTFVTPATIRKIHNVIRSAFTQAEKWEMVERNPAKLATLPKQEVQHREIWDAPTLFKAIDSCEDERLRLCLNVAFACSLRIGELLGLTWDCVDVSEESILAGKASIFVNKELQRVNKSIMDTLDAKDVIKVFPEQGFRNKTVLVLKTPKTATSTRKIFLPKTVAEMLVAWKTEQDATIAALGDEYMNYNLVIATPTGMPTEASRIRKAMKDLIEENNLPPVVFHSLRHSSITYKLKLNGGDIKAVQGDSGHAQASMVTDQYSHILDENRRTNAELIEEAFYEGRGSEPMSPKKARNDDDNEQEQTANIDPALINKILGNPDMVKMLQMLSGSLS